MTPIQFGILVGLILLAIGFSCYATAKIKAAIQVATQCLAGQLSLRRDVTTLSHELEALKDGTEQRLDEATGIARRRKEPDGEGPH